MSFYSFGFPSPSTFLTDSENNFQLHPRRSYQSFYLSSIFLLLCSANVVSHNLYETQQQSVKLTKLRWKQSFPSFTNWTVNRGMWEERNWIKNTKVCFCWFSSRFTLNVFKSFIGTGSSRIASNDGFSKETSDASTDLFRRLNHLSISRSLSKRLRATWSQSEERTLNRKRFGNNFRFAI